MGNSRYSGSAYSSMSASSRTTVRSESTQIRNTNRFPVKALTWLACGVQSGADIRKTTTTTVIPAGRRSSHNGRSARLHSSEITYEWVARRVEDEDEDDVRHWPPHVSSGSRQGYKPNGGGIPTGRPPRSTYRRSPSIEPPRMRYPQPPAQGRPPQPPAQPRYPQGPARRRPAPPTQGRPPPPPAQGRPPPPPAHGIPPPPPPP